MIIERTINEYPSFKVKYLPLISELKAAKNEKMQLNKEI